MHYFGTLAILQASFKQQAVYLYIDERVRNTNTIAMDIMKTKNYWLSGVSEYIEEAVWKPRISS